MDEQRPDLSRWHRDLEAPADEEERRRAEEREQRRLERERRRAARGSGGDSGAGAHPVRRSRARGPRRVRPTLRRPEPRSLVALAVVALLALLGGGLALAARAAAPDLRAEGPEPNAVVGAAAAAKLTFAVGADAGTLGRVRWTIDGEDATSRARVVGGRSLLRAPDLPEGQHEVAASAPGPFIGATARRTWSLTVDRTPPSLSVDAATTTRPPALPMKLRGTVEAGATLVANGRRVPAADGSFAVDFDEPPAKPVLLVATDPAGNRTEHRATITLVPRKPRAPVRSVHVTFYAWANDELRASILKLVDEGRINAVQLDLKDESGIVGWDAPVPFGKRIGAVQGIVDLERAVDTLHARGVTVIGRLVAFRDPIHAREAWRRGWRNQVVQTPQGLPYAGYGGFTNFANPTVRQYNVDVARAAAAAGVDDILFDYIRRPDGPVSSMRFPGLAGTAERSIADFLGEARRALKPYRAFLGASVFGVASTRPLEVAQDIPAMARNCDYIAPMLYPSHWGPGEYDVANPNAQPYDIVFRSLKDFQEKTKGTGARVVPWLQDFSLGVAYGPNEVRAQIRAARDVGIPEWILWDPLVTYTVDALDRQPRLPPVETRRVALRPAPTGPQQPTRPAAAPADAAASAAARRVKANELGAVPVIMYHQIRADGGGDYDLTPAQFRAELARLRREGYVPVRAVDLATGRLDVPAGKTPVVLTFDDSTKEQLAWDANGRPKKDTAVAILQEFARQHRDFPATGTFYVNRAPFAVADAEGRRMLRWLHEQGFELGNHTHDHIPFGGMAAGEVQRQLVLGKRLIVATVPGAKVRTMALPLGVMPKPPLLARKGTWGGEGYEHAGVFLVGAEPAPSPHSTSFRPGAIPRIRTSPPGARDPAFGSTYWLDELRRDPSRRYVSDGDPKRISFPRARAGELRPRLRERANAY